MALIIISIMTTAAMIPKIKVVIGDRSPKSWLMLAVVEETKLDGISIIYFVANTLLSGQKQSKIGV